MSQYLPVRISIALLFAAVAIAAGVVLLPPNVFWIVDEGTRFIQLQSVSHLGGIEVVYPGRSLDPSLHLLPDAGQHLIRIGSHVVAQYLPYFAYLNAIPYRFFGMYGIYIVPALGALVAMALTVALTRRLGIHDPFGLIPLALLFCSPLYFYAITYWEYTAALALSTGALVLLMRSSDYRACAVAGALLACSTLLREEGYVFTIAVLLALVIRDRALRPAGVAALAFAAAMLPAWLWHDQLFGSILGLHATVYERYAQESVARARTVFDYLLRFRPSTTVSLALVAPQILAIFAPRRWRFAVLALACAAAIATPILLALDSDRIMATASSQGLLPSLPFLTLALLAWREIDRFLGATCLLFAAGACAMLSSGGTWIIWGPRHFFPILPLLVVLSAQAWERLGRPRAAVLLIGAAFLIQANGIADLALKKHGTERILDAIAADGTDVVVTDVFWLPQEMASIFYTKTFLLAKTDADANAAVAALRARGIQRFTFVGARHYRTLTDRSLAPIVGMATRRTRVLTPGMELMDVMVLSCDLRKQRTSS